jgi:hypothetical protein
MPPIVKRALRNRWFVTAVHACLWLLLYLAVAGLGGKAPDLRDADGATSPPHSSVPVAGLEQLFSSGSWPKSLVETNRLDPFVTHYFIPPVAPPPTTRKIEVTYQGFYQTNNGPKHTIFKLGDTFQIAPIGTRIATNLFIADATMQTLTLTNLAAQTNVLPLNTKKEIVVPIQ